MRYGLAERLYGRFYHGACMRAMRREAPGSSYASRETRRKIMKEYAAILRRAKSIGKSPLVSAYCLGAYFIALNRGNGRHAEENYSTLRDGLFESPLFRRALGDADSYLTPKKLAARKRWAEESRAGRYENDWVVAVLDGNGAFELGLDYHRCGICRLCEDEGCPELARYLCRLDFGMADIMGVELERTQTIAEGAAFCDFRYKRKPTGHDGEK